VILQGLTIVAIVVGLYLFVSMYSATLERRREIATMRALGARRATILRIVLLESCVITLVGGCAGVVVGHGIAYLGAPWRRASGRARRAPARPERLSHGRRGKSCAAVLNDAGIERVRWSWPRRWD
jgi:FtsX-like permease family